MAESQDRTEKATPRRRQKAREKGQAPKSKDLVAIANIGAILLVFYLGIRPFWDKSSRVMASLLSFQFGNDPFMVIRQAIYDFILIILPFFLVVVATSIGVNLIQGGLVLKPLSLKMDKMNPLSGLKNIYSLSGLMETGKTLIKFLVGLILMYHFIRKSVELFPLLLHMEMIELTRAIGYLILRAFLYGFFFYLILAVLDYFLQKRKFEQSIRMSQQEVKEEAKEIEGNPLIKSRIKSLQREMARRRMMAEVPKASVIITNPEHLAIALRYKEKEMSAPKVVAKGADLVAQKIKELARKHGVPIIEDKPLARVLFKLELNTFIPPELYKAVAKIIAHIYKIKKMAG
jgi:flagellar biosynthetic protein FlhB